MTGHLKRLLREARCPLHHSRSTPGSFWFSVKRNSWLRMDGERAPTGNGRGEGSMCRSKQGREGKAGTGERTACHFTRASLLHSAVLQRPGVLDGICRHASMLPLVYNGIQQDVTQSPEWPGRPSQARESVDSEALVRPEGFSLEEANNQKEPSMLVASEPHAFHATDGSFVMRWHSSLSRCVQVGNCHWEIYPDKAAARSIH